MMEDLLVRYYASVHNRSSWAFVKAVHGFDSKDVVPEDHPFRKQMEREVWDLDAAISRHELDTPIHQITNVIVGQGYAAELINVEYSDRTAEIEISNPHYTGEVLDRRDGDGKRAVGVRGEWVGRIRIYTRRDDFTNLEYNYKFIDTPYSKRRSSWRHGDMRMTSTLQVLLRKIKAELPLLTAERVAANRAARLESLALENKRHAHWGHKRLLAALLDKHGARAFEILAEANVVLPDDFKAAMNEYLDLQTVLNGMKEYDE